MLRNPIGYHTEITHLLPASPSNWELYLKLGSETFILNLPHLAQSTGNICQLGRPRHLTLIVAMAALLEPQTDPAACAQPLSSVPWNHPTTAAMTCLVFFVLSKAAGPELKMEEFASQ